MVRRATPTRKERRTEDGDSVRELLDVLPGRADD